MVEQGFEPGQYNSRVHVLNHHGTINRKRLLRNTPPYVYGKKEKEKRPRLLYRKYTISTVPDKEKEEKPPNYNTSKTLIPKPIDFINKIHFTNINLKTYDY